MTGFFDGLTEDIRVVTQSERGAGTNEEGGVEDNAFGVGNLLSLARGREALAEDVVCNVPRDFEGQPLVDEHLDERPLVADANALHVGHSLKMFGLDAAQAMMASPPFGVNGSPVAVSM